MRNLTFKLFALILLFLVGSKAVQAQDVVVIVNSGVAVSTISSGDMKAIYKGEKTSWSDGSTIVALAQKKTQPATKLFLENKAGMSLVEYNKHWQQAVFTGAGTPPREFASDAEIVQAVASTPGAIGYVSSGTDTGAAKVINQ